MFPSISVVQEIGIAVLLVVALVRVVGLARTLWDNRFHQEGPAASESLPLIPSQRDRAAHPMESVELTEAEKQAFAGLIRTIPLH
ncbi:hypothetical protein ACWDYJ_01995 [Streptomyces sp. NPDC003042]